MTVRLRPMSATEYHAYIERVTPKYAGEGAKATGMPPDEALAFAKKQLAGLLPGGRATPGHHFRTLVDAEGADVGILWFAEQFEQNPPSVFIYDIDVEEDHRGRGLGSATLRALESEARKLGAEAVGLHVFETNEGAIRLYERTGYECTRRKAGGLQMRKRV